MRIAYVCLDPGIPVFGTKGASVHVQEVVRRMLADGHEVTLHCVREGDHRPADLSDLTGLRVVCHPVGKGDAAARERAQLAASDEAARAVIAEGCDLVYERYSLFSTALARVAGALGVPGVLEVNAPLIDEQARHRSLVHAAEARAALTGQATAAARIVCVSAPVAGWVQQTTGLPDLPTVVLPNGVNTERIGPTRPEPGPPVVAFVGTLKPWHGVEVLLAAAALARTPWRLRVVGGGPQEAALRAQAADLGLDCAFTGHVAPAAMPTALAGVAIGAAPYPASTDHYFSPLKVFEYAAAGLPVVASRIGQLPEIVADGRTGLLVPPSEPAALAAAIDELAADPTRREAMGLAARLDAVERFDWRRVVDASLQGLVPVVTRG